MAPARVAGGILVICQISCARRVDLLHYHGHRKAEVQPRLDQELNRADRLLAAPASPGGSHQQYVRMSPSPRVPLASRQVYSTW